MNHGFIKEITEAYAEEYQPSLDVPAISQKVIEDIADIKVKDKPLYNTLFEESAVSQQRIIYGLIDLHLNVYEQMQEEITSINENLIDDDVIYEIGIGSFTVMLGLAAFFGGRDRLAFKRFKTQMNSAVSAFFKDNDSKRRFKIIENIIEKNLFSCRTHCDLSTDQSRPNIPFTNIDIPGSRTRQGSEKKRINALLFGKKVSGIPINVGGSSAEDIEKEKCLISCYLDGITSVIAELTSNVINCMKTTGDGSVVIEPGQGMMTILSHPASEECLVIHDKLKSLNDELAEILKIKAVQYKDHNFGREWLNILDEKIAKTKNNLHLKPIGRKPKFNKQKIRTKTGNFNPNSLKQSQRINFSNK